MVWGLLTHVSAPSQPTRRRLFDIISRRPGIHASEVARESGEAWSTVQYHLDLLAKADMVQTMEAGRERRFFSSDVDADKARMLTLLDQGRRQEIVDFILENPGMRQVDVCKEVGVSRKTFRSSIAPLVEEGLIRERKELQANRYFAEDALEAIVNPGPTFSPDAA